MTDWISPTQLAERFLPLALACRDAVSDRYRQIPATTENENVAAFYVVGLIERIARMFYHTLILWDSENLPEAGVLARSVVEASLLRQAICKDEWPTCDFAKNYHVAAKLRILKNITAIEQVPLPAEPAFSEAAHDRTTQKAEQLRAKLGGQTSSLPSWMDLARKHHRSQEYVILYTVLSSLTHPIALTYHALPRHAGRTVAEAQALAPLMRVLQLTVDPVVTDAIEAVCKRFNLDAIWADTSYLFQQRVKTWLWRVRRLDEITESPPS